jgi:Zn-dependent alcohol dehydrogenase
MVEIRAIGICHTYGFTLAGADPKACSHRPPATGAGVLVEVGGGGRA